MSTTLDIDKNYLKLSQIFHASDRKNLNIDKIKTILNSGYDINYAVLPPNRSVDYFDRRRLGYTVLHFVLVSGNLFGKDYYPLVKELLRRGADVVSKSQNGVTPLHLAFDYYYFLCDLDQLDFYDNPTINCLLSAQIEQCNGTNPCDKNGMSHFHIACITNNFEAVKFLLKSGVSVNQAIGIDSRRLAGFTPLHLVMVSQNKQLVQLLLEYGADPKRLNAKGLSPLHVLVQKQIYDTIESEILPNEYILNEVSKSALEPVDCLGLSCFHVYCMRTKSFKMDDWERFLKEGVDLFAPVNFDSPFCPGYTAMHFAAHLNLQTVKLLVDNGANLLAKDAKGTTPLVLCLENHADQIHRIIEIMETQETLRSIRFRNGVSLINVLAAFQANKLEKFLWNADIDATITLDSPLWPGYTLLHIAVMLSRRITESENDFDSKIDYVQLTPYVDKCLKYEPDVTIKDVNGITAIHLAMRMDKALYAFQMIEAHKNFSVNPADPENNLSHLHVACLAKNTNLLKKFLNSGSDPNAAVKSELRFHFKSWDIYERLTIRANFTALHVAVIVGSIKIIKLLLEYDADPCLLDAYGFDLLHLAFTNDPGGNFEEIYWLHSKALESNPVSQGGLTHFHIACYYGNMNAMEALLPHVTDINAPIGKDLNKFTTGVITGAGVTPLHMAVRRNSLEAVDFLLKNGADVDAIDESGLSPLHVALIHSWHEDSTKIIQLLARNKREKSIGYSQSAELLVALALEKQPFMIKLVDKEEDFPLRYFQSQDLIVNREGLSSFHISCMEKDPFRVEKLVGLGVDVNATKEYFARKDGGRTPLHYAVDCGNESVVYVLLKHGADVTLEDASGHTPVHLAALKHPEMIKLFVSATKVVIGTTNAFGQTILDCLCENPNASSDHFFDLMKMGTEIEKIDLITKMRVMVKLSHKFSGSIFKSLIECIPNVTDIDQNNQNVIHHLVIASSKDWKVNFDGFVGNLEFLLERGCDIDHRDKEGMTPLHRAVIANNDKTTEALLSLGGDVNILNNDGKTPCIFANDAIFKILFDYVHKLRQAGIHIDRVNSEFLRLGNVGTIRYWFDLQQMRKISVTKSISVRDLLMEKTIMRFPLMPKHQRLSIRKYIDSNELRMKFPDWLPVFKLQRRRALKRELLFQPAFNALEGLLNRNLPEHCLESILVYLRNEDYQNLVLTKETPL